MAYPLNPMSANPDSDRQQKRKILESYINSGQYSEQQLIELMHTLGLDSDADAAMALRKHRVETQDTGESTRTTQAQNPERFAKFGWTPQVLRTITNEMDYQRALKRANNPATVAEAMGNAAIQRGVANQNQNQSQVKPQSLQPSGTMTNEQWRSLPGTASLFPSTPPPPPAWPQQSQNTSQPISQDEINHLYKTQNTNFLNKGSMGAPQGIIFHHMSGRGDAQNILETFAKNGYSSHYHIDRNGNITQLVPDGTRTFHMANGYGPVGTGKSNNNMLGVEVAAMNDKDVLDAQKQAGLRLAQQLGQKYGFDPRTASFGHGEVNPGHKEADEGMGIVNLLRDGSNPNVMASNAIQPTTQFPPEIQKMIDAAAPIKNNVRSMSELLGANPIAQSQAPTTAPVADQTLDTGVLGQPSASAVPPSPMSLYARPEENQQAMIDYLMNNQMVG